MTQQQAYAALLAAYQKFLGRDPEDSAALESHLNGDYSQASVDRAIGVIVNSPEAREYTERQTRTTQGQTGTEAGQTYTGFDPAHAFEGFDFQREQNTGKSAKDAFAYLANRAPAPPLHDKAALEAWFRQYIEPGMNALGHRITRVQGDVFDFDNWQGKWTVDYGKNAGGGDEYQKALVWGAQPGGGAGARPYVPITPKPVAPPEEPTPPQTPGPPEPPPMPEPAPMMMSDGPPMVSLADLARSTFRAPGGPVVGETAPDGTITLRELARQRQARIGRRL